MADDSVEGEGRLSAKLRNVEGYLEELERIKNERPEQVRNALEVYISLWNKALEKGVIRPSDEMNVALAKIEGMGGLYKAAEE